MQQGGYGYVSDTSQVNNGVATLIFGLNAGVARLAKFGFTATGGKNNAPQEALDIAFTIKGQEKSYRLFPVTKAYGKNNVEITNPQAPEMVEAFNNFNGIITHILKCFRTEQDIQSIYAQAHAAGQLQSFQGFCMVTASMLPPNFADFPLDIFAQWQHSITGDNSKTFLEIPTKMKHGLWLCNAQQAFNADGTAGEWKPVIKADPQTTDENAIMYVDGMGNVHPFKRNGWFAASHFAKQQTDASANAAGQAAIAGNPNVAAPAGWGAAPAAVPAQQPYQAPAQQAPAAPAQPAPQAFAPPVQPPAQPTQPAPVAPAQPVQPPVQQAAPVQPPVAPAAQQPQAPQEGQAPW